MRPETCSNAWPRKIGCRTKTAGEPRTFDPVVNRVGVVNYWVKHRFDLFFSAFSRDIRDRLSSSQGTSPSVGLMVER